MRATALRTKRLLVHAGFTGIDAEERPSRVTGIPYVEVMPTHTSQHKHGVNYLRGSTPNRIRIAWRYDSATPDIEDGIVMVRGKDFARILLGFIENERSKGASPSGS
ncbi:MAG: hypothetical protein ACOYB3_01905 [Azonexus sp.]